MNFFPNPAYLSTKIKPKKQEQLASVSSANDNIICQPSTVEPVPSANVWFGWIPKKV